MAARRRLGCITRRGDSYLRSLLVQGAKSAVFTAHKRSDPISRWALALRERSGWQVAAVALANKNARILWAVMTKTPGGWARTIHGSCRATRPSFPPWGLVLDLGIDFQNIAVRIAKEQRAVAKGLICGAGDETHPPRLVHLYPSHISHFAREDDGVVDAADR